MIFGKSTTFRKGGTGSGKGKSSGKTSLKQKVSNVVRGAFGLKKVKVA